MSVTLYDISGEKKGEIELPAIFDQRVRMGVVFEAVQAYRVNQRQGTAATKTRAEVRGGGHKPYRQKGTGKARHGSRRSPIFVGGGATFGPRPRAYQYHMPVKAKRAALRSALALKQREKKMLVVEGWACAAPKTKPMAATLRKLGVASGLIVLEAPNAVLQKSMRNIPNIKVLPERLLNPYDLLRYEHVVLTRAAAEQLGGRLGS